jgi:hypothetical protein
MMNFGSSMQGFGPSTRGGIPTNLNKDALKLNTSPWKLMRRLASTITGFKRELILSVIGVIGAAGLQITMPWAFKHVIDTTIPSGNARELLVIAVALTVMQGVRYLLI